MSDQVSVFEVGPRDGLQNEKQILPLQDKIWLLNALVDAGLKNIEAGSMVRPDKVPQMADSDQIQPRLNHVHAHFWYLVPNEKGLERAIAQGIKNIAVFTAVSETFNKKNIGMTVDESFIQISKIMSEAKTHGLKVRGYVSTVWGCPFEGRVTPKQALPVIDRLLSLGVDEVSVGDTIGIAAPAGVEAIFKPLVQQWGAKGKPPFAGHFHDTRGTALANTIRALDLGIRTFDSSVGGLGGCPFAPGAAGNLATEDLIYMFKEMGVDSGVDYKKLCETSISLFQKMKKGIQSKATQAFQANCTKSNPWDI